MNRVWLTPFSAPLEPTRSPEVNSPPTEEQEKMFGRQVTMKLKANAATELTRIAESEIIPIQRRRKGFRDETIFIAGDRAEAIANSFWDTAEDAEAYSQTGYPEVLRTLANTIEGIPTVRTFNFVISTRDRTFTGKLS